MSQFVQQLQAMWGRNMADGPLAPAVAALQMGAKERAVYLGHRLSRNIKVLCIPHCCQHCPAPDAADFGDLPSTLGSVLCGERPATLAM